MKKICIFISVILCASSFALICAAQGSVNSNNGLGVPDNGTNDPLTGELNGTDAPQDMATFPSDGTTADTKTVTDTASVTDADGNMSGASRTAVVIAVIAAVVIIVSAAVYLITRREKDK